MRKEMIKMKMAYHLKRHEMFLDQGKIKEAEEELIKYETYKRAVDN